MNAVFAGGSSGRVPLRVSVPVGLRAVGVPVAGDGKRGEAGVRGQQGEYREAQEGGRTREAARKGGDGGVRESGGHGGKSVAACKFASPTEFSVRKNKAPGTIMNHMYLYINQQNKYSSIAY